MTDHPTICPDCGRSLKLLPGPQVKEVCDRCGKTRFEFRPALDGSGVRVEKGQNVVIPVDYLRRMLTLDPAASKANFTREGVLWYVQSLLADGYVKSSDEIDDLLGRYDQLFDRVIRSSELLSDLNLDDPEDGQEAWNRTKGRRDLPEHWAGLGGAATQIVSQAIEDNDARMATFGMNVLGKAHAMLVFVTELFDIVWQGHSLNRLRHALAVWEEHGDNDDEMFWQRALKEHSFVLSQLFATPVVVFKDQAYVGGKSIADRDGNYVDFMLVNDLSQSISLVEIKTPETKLLGRKYRGIFSPSVELAGAVAQLSNYRQSLQRSADALEGAAEGTARAFNPRCLLIAGRIDKRLNDQVRRRSFELYRRELRDIEIVTYDELFDKVSKLLSLFER